jgi:hypothetical protein
MAGNGILSLTNPDEVFYAQTAKEMMQHHTWMTPYLFGAPQFEKPILTYWLLRLAFIFLGVTSFAARFFPALFAASGGLAVYSFGLLGFKDDKKAMRAAVILMSSGLYIGLARTVFTDLVFSIFILFSLLSFFWGYTLETRRTAGNLLFFVFAGLAVLSKGPLGIFIPLATVIFFLMLRRDLKFLLHKDVFIGLLVFFLISVPWYALMIKKYGRDFTHEFFYNTHWRRLIEAEHSSNDRWYFYPLSAIGSMFPWSLYVLFAFGHLFKCLKRGASSFELFLGCWITAGFLIFQLPHSKLVSYIFPLFPALALMTGSYISDSLEKGKDRSFFFISLGTWFFLFSVPVGLIVATHKFRFYFTSLTPVYIFACILFLCLLFISFFIFRGKLATGITLFGFLLPLFLFFAFWMHKDFDSFASSKNSCVYLLQNDKGNSPILCSKFFVRGVRYYTDKEVAVIDINGKGFFSPHPIPFLNTEEKVRGFLRPGPATYAILKKSTAKEIQKIIGTEFSAELLRVIGDEYVVRITKK